MEIACGRDFDLWTYEGGQLLRVLGGESATATISNGQAETTGKDGASWRTLLQGCGTRAMSVSWSGFVTESTKLMSQRAVSGSHDTYFVSSGSGSPIGPFIAAVANVERDGAFNGAEKKSITMEVSGQVEAATFYDSLIGAGVQVSVWSTVLAVSTYTGPCMRVRRLSDDAVKDIGFDAGIIDVVALEAFCAGAIGVIDTWYDQGGDLHLVADQSRLGVVFVTDAVGNVIIWGSYPSAYSDLEPGSPALLKVDTAGSITNHAMGSFSDVDADRPGDSEVMNLRFSSLGNVTGIDHASRNARAKAGASNAFTTGAVFKTVGHPYNILGEMVEGRPLFVHAEKLGAIDGTGLVVPALAGSGALSMFAEDGQILTDYSGMISEAYLVREDPYPAIPDFRALHLTWATSRTDFFRFG